MLDFLPLLNVWSFKFSFSRMYDLTAINKDAFLKKFDLVLYFILKVSKFIYFPSSSNKSYINNMPFLIYCLHNMVGFFVCLLVRVSLFVCLFVVFYQLIYNTRDVSISDLWESSWHFIVQYLDIFRLSLMMLIYHVWNSLNIKYVMFCDLFNLISSKVQVC